MPDITRLIIGAVFRCQPSMTKEAARAVADTIIGDMRAANLRIVSPGVARPVASGERRGASRTNVLKSGTVVFNNGNCSMECQVLDLTKAGARVKPVDILLCPNAFTLKLHHGPVHDCEVKWRKGKILGVRFL
jgi:hypothetical protein